MTKSRETVTAAELRRNVDADQDRGRDAIRKASEELSAFQITQFQVDMTGKPDVAKAHSQYKRDQLRGLESVQREPFFSRIDTVVTLRGETDPLQLLLSRARDTGGVVEGDGWRVVSWTSPAANRVRGKSPGDVVEFTVRRPVRYDIGESSSYEALLPRFANAEFRLVAGEAAVASEEELDVMLAEAAPAAALPSKTYEAKPSFGLSDIIVLVDEPQRAAMALPFDRSVIIDGPPGSGKTSIGIMRIAVLYDQQWEALGIERGVHVPFHDYSTMRVVVYNDEMVEYLKGLAQSIGVERAQVQTTRDFFRRICRQTRLLTGTERRDRQSLLVLKGRRESLRAYFAGFKSHSQRYWAEHQHDLRASLFHLAPDFLTIADTLDGWVKRISKASVQDGQIVGSIGLADSLTTVLNDIRQGRSPTRGATAPTGEAPSGGERPPRLDEDAFQQRAREARELVEEALRGACDRCEIVHQMFEQPEYRELLETLRQDGVPERTVVDGDRLWHTQYKGELPAYSELDLAMTAWMGAPILLSRGDGKPWIGARQERFTHLVVDEVQDLPPSHIDILVSQLAKDGTTTLVGDIHQNLNPDAGLRRWDDLRSLDLVPTVFGMNHRQTHQLGQFVQELHSGLFEEECRWEPSSKLVGPIPRAGKVRSWKGLEMTVAAEARHWRGTIQGETGATIAVLYDGQVPIKRLKELRHTLEQELSDQLVPVELSTPRDGGEPLRKTDCVVIASVRQAKGLEFDAVVFIEMRPVWSKPALEVDLRARNGFYVAASRARAGLSLCMIALPSCVGPIIEEGLCEQVDFSDEGEEES